MPHLQRVLLTRSWWLGVVTCACWRSRRQVHLDRPHRKSFGFLALNLCPAIRSPAHLGLHLIRRNLCLNYSGCGHPIRGAAPASWPGAPKRPGRQSFRCLGRRPRGQRSLSPAFPETQAWLSYWGSSLGHKKFVFRLQSSVLLPIHFVFYYI